MIGNSVDKVFTSMGLENCSITAEGNETVVQVVMFQGDLTSCDEIKTSIVVTIALLSGIVMVSHTVHPRLSEPRLSESSIIRTPKIIIFIRF